jgi:RNA polymerase sigma-70 factor (ECF subfamily)
MAGSKRRLWGIGASNSLPPSEANPGHGRSQGFENLLVAHLDSLYAAAVRVTKDAQQAEDLVQEACLKAWRNRGQLEKPQAIKAWLFKILMNTFINSYRQTSREPQIVDIELSEAMLERIHTESGESRTDPLNLLLDQCLDDEIQEAYDGLHTEIRAVVWLSDVEGFRQHEIAEMLGCPPGTVASRLFRGRALLREQLQEYAKRRRWVKE